MSASKFHQFEEKTIEGKPVTLAEYAGKVVLVVNVASRCGFTNQYEGLEALYKKHASAGLVILGFPCDQFGNQEPGSNEEIKSFCTLTYGVTFPMFKKVEVNGPNASPLYTYLRQQQPGAPGSDAVKWNFTKFLVDREGAVVKRFEPAQTPASIEAEITRLLARR